MTYVDPETVLVPRSKVRSLHVIYTTGPGRDSWSVALLNWSGKQVLGIRWNGGEDDSVGNPQSHARPTWFVVPDKLVEAVRDRAEQLANMSETGLLAGYRDMANDRRREAEALEWSEGLIGDSAG